MFLLTVKEKFHGLLKMNFFTVCKPGKFMENKPGKCIYFFSRLCSSLLKEG